MAVVAVNLEPGTQRVSRPHRVYLRAKWYEPWVRMPYLFAEEVAWRLAPGLSTANLVWRYGYGMRQGESSLRLIQRLADVRRQFVKIEIDTQDGSNPLKWFGTIELDGRARTWLIQVNQNTQVEAGEQPLVAVGLAHALYRTPIRGATWLDADGKAHRAERPFVFNRPNAAGEPRGNRSKGRGGLAHRTSYCFSSSLADEDERWTTRTILEYLVAQEIPAGPGGVPQIQVAVDPDTEQVLPTWDTPVIDPTGGMSVGDVINLLLPRQRMLSWHLTVYQDPELTGDFEGVYLTAVSLLGENVKTDLGTLHRHPRQIALQDTISSAQAPDTVYSLKESDIPAIDQARVRGARRTSTCTLSHPDETIDAGWATAQETEYQQGFSAADGYADLTVDEKQAANAEVRNSDRLFAVYRRFAIPEDWNQRVRDGLGGGAEKPVFLAYDSGGQGLRPVNPRELELAPTLPLKDGYNYQRIGSPTFRVPPEQVSPGPHGRLPALVLFKTPAFEGEGDAPWIQVDTIASGAAIEQVRTHHSRYFSCRVEVPEQDRAVLLHVEGKPQHVLAFQDFQRLEVDEYQGRWDWREALFTVCILDDRFAEGVWPDEDTAKEQTVCLRRDLVVYAGEQYRLDYLVQGTVVAVSKSDRQPVRCARGGWINDDRQVLTARAQQIYAYYGQTRRSLELDTPVITSQIQLGDYVTKVGSGAGELAVGTTVSEIVVRIPGGPRPGPVRAHYATAFAELEAFELVNRPPARGRGGGA